MPGFSSFFLIRGPPPTPDSKSDSDPKILRTLLRRKTRRKATQIITIYGMCLRRADVASMHASLVQLQRDVHAQIEAFHDAGITSSKPRKRILREFAEVNSWIMRDVEDILQVLQITPGPIEELRNGLDDLDRVADLHGRQGLHNDDITSLVELVIAHRVS
ncbi:hypothetical protein FB567DRAFT_599228 [Paraphoma chrysanthemicola]|uniref:Uncharacterized protein n=1 Tax=Paraphoma chrysanthemicola TaxID=798071 RepID=A0A8K0QTV2_9PLEO|nr:hypothetical protein FB567DRAFT_599228 [Paraphoma chrysanthemicola]